MSAVGCGGSGSKLLEGFNPPAPTASQLQLLVPITQPIKSGDSVEMCSWTDQILTKDTFLKGATGFQSATGHHIVVYYTTVPQPAGTSRVCKDEDMATFRYAIGVGGAGEHVPLPGQLVTKLPKGAQLVMNHHWLNATRNTVKGQAAVNLDLVELSSDYVQSGAIAIVDTSLRIHPGVQGLDIACTLPRDFKFWQITPHMHAYGTHITIDHQAVSGATSQVIEVNNWTDEYTFHPPQLNFDPAAPKVMQKGDTVKIHCDWNNSTQQDLTFGLEMCVGFGLTVNETGEENIACDQGDWSQF